MNTVKASGFQNMKKTNHSPNVCPLPSMIRSDNFCIASNSRRMRRTRWTWFILSAPFHTCHVTALFCHSITIQSLVNHYKYFVHIWNSRNNQLRAEAKNCHNKWSEALSERENPLYVRSEIVLIKIGRPFIQYYIIQFFKNLCCNFLFESYGSLPRFSHWESFK